MDFNWQRADTLKEGDTVRIAGYDLLVTDITIAGEDVSVTTERGHNGVRGQVYNLKTWQEVEISRK